MTGEVNEEMKILRMAIKDIENELFPLYAEQRSLKYEQFTND